MANAAQQTAPVKKATATESDENIALNQVFDTQKKYVFELVQQNEERELPVLFVQGQKSSIAPHKKFSPYRNIVLTSQVVWNGQRRTIRYYDGCTSIFVDEQPKEKETVDQFIAQSKRRSFQEGKFSCHGDERMLLLYLNICSWNVESKFRTRTADGIFLAINPDKAATAQTNKLDQIELAMRYAKEATNQKMMIHAAYLGVAVEDWDSGNELSPEAIRANYRQEAMRDPASFIASYGNKGLELKYYIDEALRKNTISSREVVNKATWGSANTVICDISGLKSQEAIAQKLYEFSQTEEGEEFAIQIKSLSE